MLDQYWSRYWTNIGVKYWPMLDQYWLMSILAQYWTDIGLHWTNIVPIFNQYATNITCFIWASVSSPCRHWFPWGFSFPGIREWENSLLGFAVNYRESRETECINRRVVKARSDFSTHQSGSGKCSFCLHGSRWHSQQVSVVDCFHTPASFAGRLKHCHFSFHSGKHVLVCCIRWRRKRRGWH